MCRYDADDRMRLAIERDRFSQDGRVRGEAAAPETFAEKNDRRAADAIFPVIERPPEKRLDAKDVEVACRHATADQPLGLPLSCQREHLEVRRRNVVDRLDTIPPI
jgi:hypothetical protein